MADYDSTTVILAIIGVGGGVVAGILYLRKIFSGMGLESSGNDAAQAGLIISQSVLKDINDELKRHSQRIEELEGKVAELTSKLANVRLIALDCYQLANECECHGENRARLLEHLRQIIKDA